MENLKDLKDDLLEDLEEVLTKFSESGRRRLAKQIIHDAAFFGTKTQTPVDSIPEALGIIHEAILESYGDFKVQEEFEQFYLS